MISARDIREFRGFLRNATNRQVQGIYDKESRAGRDEYAELAVEEADRRGIYLERESHARKKKTPPTQLDREIAQVIGKKLSHATTKQALPGIAKWNTYGGGTGAAEGKYSYDYKAGIKGEYHIMPFTTKYGRHAGYSLKYAATGGQPRGSHGGLWHDLGTFRSPASAAKAAREHYARSFD